MTNQFENRDFHHTLLEIRRLVLDHLDGDNLVRFHVLTLDDLAEGTLSQHIENQISNRKIINQHGFEDGQRDKTDRSLSSGPRMSLT